MNDLARFIQDALRSDLAAFHHRVFQTLEPATTFSPNWHYEHLAWALSRVEKGEIRRLIINVPPRSGKSILASVAWPMFLLGHAPERRIICVSHTEDLARKFSVDRRTIAQSRWFRHLFPRFALPGSRVRDLELTTTRMGSIFAAGAGGAILGRGADVIVIDDPIKALDALSQAERRRVAEFYDNTLSTRLNNKRSGAIVIVMQRLHEDDLVGHVLVRDDWEVISLPAIAHSATRHQLSDDPLDLYERRSGAHLHENREPADVLAAVRRSQGSILFSAQYQQDPLPVGGHIIQRSWLRYYERSPGRFDRVIASWDTASTLSETSDWSVGTVWGSVGLDYYLLGLVRGRFEAWELRKSIVALSERYAADATLIEDTELGRALAQDLRKTGQLRPLTLRPRFDKVARLMAQSARFEGGQVHLPEEAPWLAEYMNELLAFPNGRHDDQVDATSQALKFLTDRPAPDRDMVRRDLTRRNIVRRGANTGPA